MKGKGEEVVQKEEDQDKVEIKDLSEVEGGIKSTEKKEKMDDKEEDKKVVFSDSQFF